MEHRRGAQFDIAFLAQLARKRRKQRLVLLDAATRQMPSGNIGVLDQEHPAVAVQDQAAHAESQASRKPPISVEKRPYQRLQLATDKTDGHGVVRLRSGLASSIRMAL